MTKNNVESIDELGVSLTNLYVIFIRNWIFILACFITFGIAGGGIAYSERGQVKVTQIVGIDEDYFSSFFFPKLGSTLLDRAIRKTKIEVINSDFCEDVYNKGNPYFTINKFAELDLEISVSNDHKEMAEACLNKILDLLRSNHKNELIETQYNIKTVIQALGNGANHLKHQYPLLTDNFLAKLIYVSELFENQSLKIRNSEDAKLIGEARFKKYLLVGGLIGSIFGYIFCVLRFKNTRS